MSDLIRHIDHEMSKVRRTEADAIVSDIIAWLNRQGDHQQIVNKYKSRFAVGLQEDDDGNFVEYAKGDQVAAFNYGLYETLNTGTMNRIVNALATLFTQKDQSYSIVEGNEDDEKILNKFRIEGNYDLAAIASDSYSCACETGVLHISVSGDSLKYQALDPSYVTIVHGDTVEDDGEDRVSDKSEIEDAVAIIIKMDTIDDRTGKHIYRAYMGANTLYENGRMVDYVAGDSNRIPFPGEQSIRFEYKDSSGNLANPLTVYAKSIEDKRPEYPISIIRGGFVSTSELLPVSESMYLSTIELETGFSRVLKDSLEAAVQKLFVLNPNNQSLPEPVGNWHSLKAGQDVRAEQASDGAPEKAKDTLKELSAAVAGSYSVPDYQVITDLSSVPPSGVSLAIKSAPLTKQREQRIRANRTSIQRIFNIERGLINFFDLQGENLSEDGELVWDAGTLELARDEATFLSNIRAGLDAGLMSYVGAVKEWYSLATDAEAVALIEEINRQNSDNPAPKGQSQQQPSGGLPLPRGLRQQ